LWGALLHGARVVVVPYLTSRSPRAFLDLLLREQVSVLSQTPTAFRELMRAVSQAGWPPLPLRLVVFGGEALDVRLLRPWFGAYEEHRPRLVNMYGITETTVHVTVRTLTAEDARRGGSPIGAPLPDLAVTLCDENMAPVPPGTAGEIVVSGPGVARGYLNLPGQTAECFVADPHGPPGARAYRSGDLAVARANGDLHFIGRKDSQVKLNGYRIELGEIEAVLGEQPSVAGAVVAVRDGPAGLPQLVAYVVPNGARTLDPEVLRAFLVRRLPGYMVPPAFVWLAELPRTANGKLDRRSLPDPGSPRKERGRKPETDSERLLAQTWAQVLGLEEVAASDNFFQLGGDSILAMRVTAGAERLGLVVEFEDIYRTGTLADLAARARPLPPARGISAAAAPGGAGAGTELMPLSMMQLGLIHDTVLRDERVAYHDLLAADVEAEFSSRALRDALGELAQRHELLRASFVLTGRGGPAQRIHATATVPLEVADLHGRSPAARARGIARLQARAVARPFEWSRPPLLRCLAIRTSDISFRVVLVLHHSIADGWSFARLATDLLLLYARGLGEQVSLPELPRARFRDFVALEQATRTSREAAGYWARAMTGARRPPTLQWERHSPGPERMTVPVPPSAVARLRALADDAAVPLKSVLLGIHAAALAEISRAAEIVTGVVVNGRPEVAGSDLLVGSYLNVLPVRIVPTADLAGTARAALAAETDILAFRRYPFAALAQRLGYQPFDVLFNHTNFHVYQELDGLQSLRVRGWSYQDRPSIPLAVEYVIRDLPDDVRVILTRWPGTVSARAMEALAGSLERRLAAIA
ncbi:MAG: condensation domain-containing protein, partial [Streptosporangiaceae bacterium]